jgi:hypothetical protein
MITVFDARILEILGVFFSELTNFTDLTLGSCGQTNAFGWSADIQSSECRPKMITRLPPDQFFPKRDQIFRTPN